MPKKMLLVLNPVSGKRAGALNQQKLLQVLGREYQIELFLTRAKGDATAVVRETAGGFDVIACCGGDGTLNEVILGLLPLAEKPPLVCIPAGTTNLLAETLGIPVRILPAAEQMLLGKPRPFDIAQMGEHCFASVVSFGAFADSSYNTSQKLKNAMGYAAYVIGGFKSLFHLGSYPLKIRHEDQAIEGEYIFGSISNCAAVGGILKFQPGVVVVDDGLFEVLLVKKPKSVADFFRILRCVRKREYPPAYFCHFRTATVSLSSEKPLPWTIDGEYKGDFQDVDVRILKNAISVIY